MRNSGFAVCWSCLVMAVLFACAGCGKTMSRAATEQLLTSDAVDRAVARIDFRDLAGQKVYFDTQYIQYIKEQGFVNAPYIISSLRQQMMAANCLLQEKKEDADYIVEARVGALGTDSTEVIYGVPANNLLTVVGSVVPTAPTLPTIPEMAFAKKNDQFAAAKIGVFAYSRETREPVWQAGLSKGRSTSKDTWLFGAGPFQSGTIYNRRRFAGTPLLDGAEDWTEQPLVQYSQPHHFAAAPNRKHEPLPNGVTYEPVASDDEPAGQAKASDGVQQAGLTTESKEAESAKTVEPAKGETPPKSEDAAKKTETAAAEASK